MKIAIGGRSKYILKLALTIVFMAAKAEWFFVDIWRLLSAFSLVYYPIMLVHFFSIHPIKAIYDNDGKCITFRDLEEYVDPEKAYAYTH